LYLVDNGFLELHFNGLALSLQRCYHLLLTDCAAPLEHYFVYKDLISKGYIVQNSNAPFVFNVWGVEKKKTFAKSNPGNPDFRILFTGSHSNFPNSSTIPTLLQEAKGSRVLIALECTGTVTLIELSHPETNLFLLDSSVVDAQQKTTGSAK
jgi:hypothetical protein